MLRVDRIGVHIAEHAIVDGVGFSVEEQQWLMIVGPNGAGKSTLLSAIAQDIPYTGTVTFAGRDLSRDRPAERAKKLGFLMQNNSVEYSFTVEEVVRLGRYAYSRGMFHALSAADAAKVEEAMELTGVIDLREQSVLTLSGGELQRTFLAQLLAQDPQLLIMDEPCNHLDLIYQKQVFDLIGEWVRRPGRAVISVVHDLSLAKAYGTHALLLHRGKRVDCGGAGEVLCEENLRSAYAMDVYAWMRGILSQWQ